MAIDNIMGGKRADDVHREQQKQQRGEERKRELHAKQLQAVPEHASDALSQDSRISKPLDGVMHTNLADPRKKHAVN